MLISVLSFVAILSILILIHEWGHFFAAKRFGIWVEEFGLGLPPRAYSRKRGDTIFSLNWLPVGGFVRLHGESLDEDITDPARAFLRKSKKIRTLVIVAGVAMNLLLGIIAFSVVYSFTGVPRDLGHVEITEVFEGSPAQSSGLRVGDVISQIDGVSVSNNRQFISLINEKKGEEVGLVIQRQGETLNLQAVPRTNPPEGEGSLGISVTSKEIYFPPVWQRPFYGIYYGFGEAIFWGKAVIQGLVSVGSDVSRGQVPKDIAGPIGIFNISSEVCRLGALPCINFMGVLSVNLAIFNFLPIPALDGGRLLFISIEAISRRKVTPKLENTIHVVGMAVLLMFILMISFFDIKRLAGQNQLPDFLMQFFK